MDLSELTAISPLDGRYRSKLKGLASYFSEYALIKYRVKIEVEYFIALCELPVPMLKDFDKAHFPLLRDLFDNFSESDAKRVKDIERTINHDVKAVEYLIKEKVVFCLYLLSLFMLSNFYLRWKIKLLIGVNSKSLFILD